MRNLIPKTIAILITAMVFLMASGSSPQHIVFAEDGGTPTERDTQTTAPDGSRIGCEEVKGAKGGVILGYIIPCVTYTIEGSTERMSSKFMDMMKPTIFAFMTLSVILFGVRVLQGGGQVHSEGILLLLKMGIVLALIDLIPHTFVPMLYDVMNESLEIVSGAIGPDESAIHCDISKYKNADATLLWAQMDCVIGKLWGVTMGSGDKPNMLLAASIFGLLGGFLFGGSFGVILFLACIGVLWTMFMLVIRTVVAFLNGYLYASLLFIVSPLFIPLILMKASVQYFEPWWKGILASILLPVIISAYGMFGLLLYDRILFDDGKESGKPALMYQLFDNEMVKKLQNVPRPACDLQRPGNLAQRPESTGLTEDQIYKNNPFFRNFVNPLLMGANNQCLGITKDTLEMTRGLDVKSNREAFTKLFYDCAKLLVLAMMINMGYVNVSSLARRLIGSGGVASSLDARGPIETKIATMQAQMRHSLSNAFDKNAGQRDERGNELGLSGETTSGTEFIERLKNVPTYLGRGIISGISRE